MIRVLVVDDHAVVRAGICRLVEGEDDMTVVGQTGSGHEAVRLCRELRPDLVLLDYALPDLEGLEVTSQIVALGQKTRVLVLTMHASEEYAIRLIRAGAGGFVVKVADPEALLGAIRKVVTGGVYVSPTVLEKMVGRMGQALPDAPEAALSDRELEVLVRLARGMTTREAAQALHLSPSTVETYRARLMEKLNLRNTSDLTRFAIRRGLIGLE